MTAFVITVTNLSKHYKIPVRQAGDAPDGSGLPDLRRVSGRSYHGASA